MMGIDPAMNERLSDGLITLRQFVGAANQALNGDKLKDQTYADADRAAVNPPGQFQVVGPQGRVSVEGKPIMLTDGGGLQLSPAAVVFMLGVAAAVGWSMLRGKR